MSPKTLSRWYEKRRAEYASLVSECSSVPELMLRIEVTGRRWTKWDWAMFMSYMDFDDCACEKPLGVYCDEPSDEMAENARLLTSDMLDTVVNGSALDGVASDKTVVMSFIEFAACRPGSAPSAYRFLARAFTKFPSMWRMNWMFIRHRDGSRTHRLEDALPNLRRSRDYYESDAFRSDFVSKYWRTGVRWLS